MTLDNMTGITKGSYTVGDLFCKSQLITCKRVKECNGVCPFEDALKHADQAVKAIKSLPSAEPKTGEVNAVEIYEQAVSELDHNKITLGEYEKRIEPLKRLFYDRPTGEWVEVEEYDCVCYQCDQCKSEYVLIDGTPQDNDYNYCPHCGAYMKGENK